MRKERVFYEYFSFLIAIGLLLVILGFIIQHPFGSRIAEIIGAALLVAGFTTALHDYILYQRVTYKYFRLLEGAGKADILNIFPDREAAIKEIKTLIPSVRRGIDILGISHTDFIYDGEFRRNINSFIRSNIKIRALFLDKESKASSERTRREEAKDNIKDTQLYSDLVNCERFYDDLKKRLDDLKKNPDQRTILQLEYNHYKTQPSLFIVIIDDVMFYEPYHLGIEKEEEGPFARCLGKRVPVIQVDTRARVFQIMKSHFEYIWQQSKKQAPSPNTG